MRSKSRFFYLLVAIMATVNLQAQSNYLSGYILKLNGDTLHGRIDYQNWSQSPSAINFWPEKGDSSTSYGPQDIKAFHVSDDDYVSANVQLEMSPRKTERLQSEKALQYIYRSVFLQPIFHNVPKNLYAYEDEFANKHFFIREDTTFKLLVYKKYLDAKNDNLSFIENKKYVGQLLFYFSDYPSLSSLINSTEYTQASLFKLFSKYLALSQGKASLGMKLNKPIIRFGVLTGPSITSLEFASKTWPSIIDAGYKPSFSMVPALSFEFIEGRNRNRWSSYNELLYSNYGVEGNSKDDLYRYHTKLDFQYLYFSSLVRYTLPLETYKPFVNVGFCFGYLLKAETSKIAQSILFADRVDYDRALGEFRKLETALAFGFGVRNKHLSYQYRFSAGNGMSPYLSLKSNVVRNMILIGYSF